MKWMRLTRHSGDEIFVNLAQVVYVEPWEQSGVRGAKVHTVFKDKDGMPMQIEVREAPETKGFRAVPNPQARPLRRSLHGGGGQTRQSVWGEVVRKERIANEIEVLEMSATNDEG